MTRQKWRVLILVILLLSSAFIVQAKPIQQETSNNFSPQRTAAERAKRFEPANALWLLDARKLYTRHCKSCHHRGNDVGATCFNVESKTQQAWDHVFEKRYSECAKNGSWDSLSAKQLQDINDFLYRYAYGTERKYVDPYR